MLSNARSKSSVRVYSFKGDRKSGFLKSRSRPHETLTFEENVRFVEAERAPSARGLTPLCRAGLGRVRVRWRCCAAALWILGMIHFICTVSVCVWGGLLHWRGHEGARSFGERGLLPPKIWWKRPVSTKREEACFHQAIWWNGPAPTKHLVEGARFHQQHTMALPLHGLMRPRHLPPIDPGRSRPQTVPNAQYSMVL